MDDGNRPRRERWKEEKAKRGPVGPACVKPPCTTQRTDWAEPETQRLWATLGVELDSSRSGCKVGLSRAGNDWGRLSWSPNNSKVPSSLPLNLRPNPAYAEPGHVLVVPIRLSSVPLFDECGRL